MTYPPGYNYALGDGTRRGQSNQPIMMEDDVLAIQRVFALHNLVYQLNDEEEAIVTRAHSQWIIAMQQDSIEEMIRILTDHGIATLQFTRNKTFDSFLKKWKQENATKSQDFPVASNPDRLPK